jgi:hypothetical protein
VGKKSDHHNAPINHVNAANLFDRICALSPCILCVRNVTFLTYFHPTFFLHTILDVGVVPADITYMDTEDKYKYMVLKIHIFKVHIFKLHILYLEITKIHIFQSIEVSDFFLGLA